MSEALNQAFRQAMRQMAGGVCVITANDAEQRTGLTATSVVSVSMDPPELLISVNRTSSSWPVLERAGRFGINVLSRAQQHVAENFSGKGGLRGAARYADDDWMQTREGVWLSRRALAVFACDIEKVLEHRQHALIVGKVSFIDIAPGMPPLAYWQGNYGTFAPWGRNHHQPCARIPHAPRAQCRKAVYPRRTQCTRTAMRAVLRPPAARAA